MTEAKIQQAQFLHARGFNCAQSTALPFCRELGMDEKDAMRALEGFGAGMGGMQQTCGALSGAVFVAGLKYSDGNLEAPASKRQTYGVCKGLCEEFTRQCGSSVCQEIKGMGTGTPLTSCADCIRIAAELTCKMLEKDRP